MRETVPQGESVSLRGVETVADQPADVGIEKLRLGVRIGFDLSSFQTDAEPVQVKLEHLELAARRHLVSLRSGKCWTPWIAPGRWSATHSLREGGKIQREVLVEGGVETLVEVVR